MGRYQFCIRKTLSTEFINGLLRRYWQRRRVVFSSDIVGFAKLNDDAMVDVIKIEEIESVDIIEPESEKVSFLSKFWNASKVVSKTRNSDISADGMNLFCNSFKIETATDGHSQGRTYYLQCKCKQR